MMNFSLDANTFKAILEDRTKKAYLIAFGALAVIFYILIVRCDLGGLKQLNTSSTDTVKIEQVLKKINIYQDYIAKFNSTFVIDQGPSTLIWFVGEAAESESVVLDRVRPLESKTVPGYRMIRVSAEGVSSYAGILRLLNRIENGDKRLFVEELEMSSEGYSQASDRSKGAGQGGIPSKFRFVVATLCRER